VALLSQFRVKRHPDPDREHLAERATADFHTWNCILMGGQFKGGAVFFKGVKKVPGKIALVGKNDIEGKGIMTGGEKEPIPVGPPGLRGPVVDIPVKERCHHVDTGERLGKIRTASAVCDIEQRFAVTAGVVSQLGN